MRELPILLSAAMVRAILEGRKSQTRRAVKVPHQNPLGQWESTTVGGFDKHRVEHPDHAALWHTRTGDTLICPYGQPGDRMWVRETWMPGYDHEADHEDGPKVSVIYRADNAEETVAAPSYELAEQWQRKFSEDGHDAPPWRSSIHMPRWACRLVLEITDVRVERLQDGDGDLDSESRYLAEGIHRIHHGDGAYYYSAFRDEPHPQNWTHADSAWRELWTSINGQASWDANPWVWVVHFKRIEP